MDDGRQTCVSDRLQMYHREERDIDHIHTVVGDVEGHSEERVLLHTPEGV